MSIDSLIRNDHMVRDVEFGIADTGEENCKVAKYVAAFEELTSCIYIYRHSSTYSSTEIGRTAPRSKLLCRSYLYLIFVGLVSVCGRVAKWIPRCPPEAKTAGSSPAVIELLFEK